MSQFPACMYFFLNLCWGDLTRPPNNPYRPLLAYRIVLINDTVIILCCRIRLSTWFNKSAWHGVLIIVKTWLNSVKSMSFPVLFHTIFLRFHNLHTFFVNSRSQLFNFGWNVLSQKKKKIYTASITKHRQDCQGITLLFLSVSFLHLKSYTKLSHQMYPMRVPKFIVSRKWSAFVINFRKKHCRT